MRDPASRPFLKRLLIACVPLLLLAAAPTHAQLSKDDFTRLHADLAAPREPWRALPWLTSLIEAQAKAVKEKKPVYMLVRSGHPLACV